jgi:hypothetical protein
MGQAIARAVQLGVRELKIVANDGRDVWLALRVELQCVSDGV